MKNKRKNEPIICLAEPNSMYAEPYKVLRSNIGFFAAHNKIKTLLITSSLIGEGKSTTIANLANVMAQGGKKVLLVDADLRRPTLHYLFRLDNQVGLVNVLFKGQSYEDVIQEIDVEGLHIIPSGPLPPNPAELIDSQQMLDLLTFAREHYDLVLIDGPPLLPVADGQILAGQVDGVLLVIRSGLLSREHIIRAKSLLEQIGAQIIGTVFNDVKMKSKKKDTYGYS